MDILVEKRNRLNDVLQYNLIVERLKERGVQLMDIAEITFNIQKEYVENLTPEICLTHVQKVILKREVQHAVLVGIELDVLTEKNIISEPLLSILKKDYGLFGIDEIIALSITNVYGSIGLTNFGFIDKSKPGIVGKLDSDAEEGHCNTFLDDIVGAIAAAACSSIAHKYAV